MRIKRIFSICFMWISFVAAAVLLFCNISSAADSEFISGADISMLPAIEKAGGIYRLDGKPADAIQILHKHGCNLFRVRLFVKPDPDFAKTDGAIQDLEYVRVLAKRIKQVGGQFLLDIHYSDTWADPEKQFTPEEWKAQDFDELQHQVGEYTSSVLKDLKSIDLLPDMVQVGNEITGGILWPLGKVLDAPPETEELQWKHFSQLFNAGAAVVRAASTESRKKIRIVIHIHGGGKEGLPKWFFGKFNVNPADYDVVGLSFYPAWGDSIDALKQNIQDVVAATGKDVLIAETSYPWKKMDKTNTAMQWPLTPEGQKQFVHDLKGALLAVPNRRGLGFMWWYPEAIPVSGLRIWRKGAEGLFDEKGNALPALKAFGQSAP